MIVYGVYIDDVYELPLAICDTISQANAIKCYYESSKDITCKIEVIEI